MRQYIRCAVLGRNLELTADMVADEFFEERIGLVRHHVIEADTGADEDLLDARNGFDPLEKFNVFAVIGAEIRTGLREQTALVRAYTVFKLFFAGGFAEIRGRTADVVDVPLESVKFRDNFGFLHAGFDASRTDGASLMERKRTEIASAEASAVVRDREADFRDCGNAAHFLIHRVIRADVGKSIDLIEFFAFERRLRRIDDEHPVVVILHDRLAADRVVVHILDAERVRIDFLVRLEIVVIVSVDLAFFRLRAETSGTGEVDLIALFAEVRRPADVADLLDRHTLVEQFRQTDDGTFAHPVHENVGAAVDQHGAADFVRPVVVMREPAKGSLQTADEDRNIAVRLADLVAVDDHGAVGTKACLAAGAVIVLTAALFRRRIMRNHGVNVPGRHKEAESGLAEFFEIVLRPPVRLAEHRHGIAGILQHTADDRRAERRMIHIRIPVHINKIHLSLHFVRRHGKKFS